MSATQLPGARRPWVLGEIKISPDLIASEVNCVAKQAVAISVANLKLAVYSSGLWPVADFVKTRSIGNTNSEGDGLAYSYTVFQNLRQLQKRWNRVNVIATAGRSDGAFGPRMTATHLLLVGWMSG